jgi:apolipoprotein N-acyltransferase
MAEQALSVQERVSEKPIPVAPAAGLASAPAAAKPRAARRPHLALPALASAGLLWLCYFPVAWGFLGWVALVPLLALVRAEASPRRIKLCAWLAGSAFFWPILTWMPVADYRMYYTWAMLATYCSLYFPVAIVLLRRLDRGTSLPLIVTVPVVWVGLEYIRSFLLTGFAWYYLGHTQHDYLAMIQVTDLGGAYLVSLLVAAVNAWVFEVLYACRPVRRLLGLPGGDQAAVTTSRRRLAVQGAVVACLIAAALGYGAYRLNEETMTPGPRLALLQGNQDQRIRNIDLSAANAEAKGAQESIYLHYGSLEYLARGTEPSLIVWPETSFPENWFEIEPQVPLDGIPVLRNKAAWIREWMLRYARGEFELPTDNPALKLKPPAANLLLGLNAQVVVSADRKPDKYNSALFVREDGSLGGRYDKIHRVPFGEYVPFRDWLPFMNAFAPYENDYSIRAGERKKRLQLGEYHFGVLICFEDTDPKLARPYGVQTEDGPPADFLVNISNDGWFDGSSEHDEHLAICRFRAIECRRSVARAVNMGISALIDSNGRVLRPIPCWNCADKSKRAAPAVIWCAQPGVSTDLPLSEWGSFKKVRGVLVAHVPIDSRTSLYSQWGDWLPITCCVVVGVGLVWAAITRRRRRALAAAGAVA